MSETILRCPERYRVNQINIRKPIINELDEFKGEYSILIENQDFAQCYKENCVAWDKEKQICKKLS